ncbi:toll/interleukin-1 receptor domain-containing protein [Gimesia sp.]|uniref:toll/interleukin-1 receptor domain-containing protein n=1 Tax=Gimesia sp. TaxID=2024833 RepID=UPI000C4D787D|nr:toll/interleukin-1 receptor domain-containing protein [Gimesia sp.]MAX40965.1 hypothetical protein [Gimesia sp.]HAH46704.1 hypothetical protein [Planctomycetaceae bacterium]HBL42042.1 hypothetical protein [Planctomycetaceae bacterium]
MANPDHVEIIKQGADAFNKWRRTNPDISPDLSNVKLTGIDLTGINLDGANLEKVDFKNINLSNSSLCNTQMRWSDLEGAAVKCSNFQNADLSHANLRNTIINKTHFGSANLLGTNFQNAKLTESSFFAALLRFSELVNADLSNSNLAHSFFLNASLKNANLENTNLYHTTWHNVDLSEAQGLEKIQHEGPSSIDFQTIESSSGKIPEVFLRGCGLSDDFILYITDHFSGSAIDFYSCFISYSHEDKLFARRLHDALQGKGIRCWLDEHQILPGDNIYDRIDHGIRVWDKVLLCASEHSLTSGWVNDELKHAFAKEKQLFKDREHEVLSLIPLNLDGYLFSGWNHPNKNQVVERMAPDFTGWESDNAKFEQQLKRVVKALQTNNTGREPEPKSKL